MRKINYKSDFDFLLRLKDKDGNAVPFPECDWDAEFWTSSKPNAYRASCIGGEYVNCFREADGSIHFVFNNHRMGKGTLKWEPHFRFPNDIYPDGIQDQFRKAQLGIELVDGDGDDVSDTPDVEVYMPAVYLTAYDLAVRNGYTGTYEDYVAYTNRFPQVVETSEAVNALLSDFADGKAMIADALTRQGVATTSDESMQTMADKVLGLQLAVEGNPQYVEHDSRIGGYDLYNAMHNHRKAEYPYMYAASFNAPTVTLSGADAYLCSDGYFTEESGTHKMPFAQEHYVIYYFRNRSFALTATAAKYINEMCVYNGAPIVNFDRVDVRRLAIYGKEPFSTDNESAMRIYGGHFADIAIETLADGYIRIESLDAVSLRLPNLITLRGGFLILYCNYIQSLMVPALATISGGTVVSSCAALTELSLPGLTTSTRGPLAANCTTLAEVNVPELEKAGETSGEYYLFEYMNYLAQDMHVHAPKLKILRCYLYSGNDNTMNGNVYLHLGAIEGGDIYLRYAGGANGSKTLVTVAEGFRSQLRMPNCINMSARQLRDIISNLGDNTGYDTLPLVFGAANLAKLTEEDIAMATSKNYTLS